LKLDIHVCPKGQIGGGLTVVAIISFWEVNSQTAQQAMCVKALVVGRSCGRLGRVPCESPLAAIQAGRDSVIPSPESFYLDAGTLAENLSGWVNDRLDRQTAAIKACLEALKDTADVLIQINR